MVEKGRSSVTCPKGFIAKCSKIATKPRLNKKTIKKLISNLSSSDQSSLVALNKRLQKQKEAHIAGESSIKDDTNKAKKIIGKAETETARLNKLEIIAEATKQRKRDVLIEELETLDIGIKETKDNIDTYNDIAGKPTKEETRDFHSDTKSLKRKEARKEEALAKISALEGSGDSKEGGTYDYEIEKVMKGVGGFKGVVASDQLDTLDVSPEMSFVYNIDKSSMPGSHWCSCRISANKDKSIEVFDPLGDKTPANILAGLKKIVDKINPKEMLKLKENNVINQRSDTDTCAFHAMRFLKDRANGESFVKATNFIERPPRDATVEGEREANQLKKQSGFGYI